MEIKKTLSLMLLATIIFSCASSSKVLPKDVQGVYVQKDNKRIELHLKNDKSFILKDNFEPTHLAIENYKCCDTISYGKWQLNKGFLSLSSPEELNTFYLNIDVTEESKKDKDSITFVINNPIEKNKKQSKYKSNELYYTINISTIDGNTIKKTIDSNLISIDKLEGISMIELEIYPKYNIDIRDISARAIYTLPYEVDNTRTNVFKINIPELNYSYMAYKRYNKDYVKIVSKNKLLWDNIEYIKL